MLEDVVRRLDHKVPEYVDIAKVEIVGKQAVWLQFLLVISREVGHDSFFELLERPPVEDELTRRPILAAIVKAKQQPGLDGKIYRSVQLLVLNADVSGESQVDISSLNEMAKFGAVTFGWKAAK